MTLLQRVWKWLQLGMMCMFLLMAVSAEAAQITDVKWGVNKEKDLRIVVDVNGSAGYDAKLDGNTMKLTISASKGSAVASRQTMRSDIATSLRVDGKGANTEILIPLNKTIDSKGYKTFVLRQDPATGRPFRVVLDVLQPDKASTTSSSSAAVAGSSSSRNTVTRGPVVGNKPTTGSSSGKTAVSSSKSSSTTSKTTKATEKKKEKDKKKNKKDSSSSKTTTASSSATTATATAANTVKRSTPYRTSGGIKGKLITIDAGHGGSDPGAIGPNGTKEKDITLPIAEYLKKYLVEKGAVVSMTRTTDKDVHSAYASARDELQARVNVAEKNNADMFISLHINSFSDRSVGGFSTYYYPKTSHDKRFATAVQTKLAKNFGVTDRGIREADYYVVKRSSMPAVLVELLFISNPKEESLLKSGWFQMKSARMMAEAIEQYFA